MGPKKGKRISLVAGLLAAISAPCYGAGAAIDDAERAKIESVVHDYLAAHPEVVLDALKEIDKRQRDAQAEQTRATLQNEREALRFAKGDFVAGNSQGDVTLVEFFDYNCGYCRKAASTVQALLADDKSLRVVLKEWPIRGEASLAAARVSLAAARQPKFLAFHFALMSADGEVDEAAALDIARKAGLDMKALAADMKSPAIDEHLTSTAVLAQKLGLDGTPAFVIGDKIVPGAMPQASFEAMIAEERDAARNEKH